ncbi:hypothetical protein [Hydrogenophaga sp.]|uniref:hypothetical protein n=1 Tax=Hydrogenophaga sp. TaxID=1904254 RepID=UPI00272B89EC|nr:hypothetical protein [Hydrogenophaga sp.]
MAEIIVSKLYRTLPPCRATRQAHTLSKPGPTSSHCAAEPAAHEDRHLTGEQMRFLTNVHSTCTPLPPGCPQ